MAVTGHHARLGTRPLAKLCRGGWVTCALKAQPAQILRILFLDAIDRIEIAIRSATSEALCRRHGAHWFLDPIHFLPSANHDQLVENLKAEIGHAGNGSGRFTSNTIIATTMIRRCHRLG
jgi:Abi-like protein